MATPSPSRGRVKETLLSEPQQPKMELHNMYRCRMVLPACLPEKRDPNAGQVGVLANMGGRIIHSAVTVL
jgi:hypothetical protein